MLLVSIQPFNTPQHREGKYYEHCHPCFEFHFIESGKTTFSCGKKRVAVLDNQILIIPPRMYHKELNSDEGTEKMTVSVDIPRSAEAPRDNHLYAVFHSEGAKSFGATASLREVLLKIKKLAADYGSSYSEREKLRAYAHLLMAEIYDELSNVQPTDGFFQKDSAMSREYEIDTHLALNFTSNSSRDELAKKLHVSPRQLHRIMIKSYGKGYREKMTETRLEIALSFLTSTDKSITSISEEMGYSSVESFSAFIKRATGRSPREIRKIGNNNK